MGSSNSHPVRETKHPQLIQRSLPSGKASEQSVIQPLQPVCTAGSSDPEPNHSLPTEQEQIPVTARELPCAQAGPGPGEQHNLEVNNIIPVPDITPPTTATEPTNNTCSPPEDEEGHSSCGWCSEIIYIEKDGLFFCKKCGSGICKDCVRKLFLDACKSEANMPPRCCVPVPLAFARDFLSEGEVSLFREKYEEWITPNRVYCPVPTCSAFIPYRLFPDTAGGKGSSKDEQTPDRDTDSAAVDGISPKVDIHTPPLTPPQSCSPCPPQPAASVRCPKCEVTICCSCKKLAHDGSPCSDVRDIDPLLERALRKWGYKRCIKCHAAVRRIFGCSHMRCRCGAQWCWYCAKPMDVCRDEGCHGNEDEDGDGKDHNSDTPDTDSDIGEDLEAGSDVVSRSGDFGDEPNTAEVDIFACEHCWESLEEDATLEYDCTRCWMKVAPLPLFAQYQGIKSLVETGSLHGQKESDDERWVSEDQAMQRCYNCSLIVCPGCADELDPDEGSQV
ncbi:predicted protein [Paecilomyces variotii No. 5]|uniref:RING-type domain-containing protein n=1 Tax=Byssochlamys spectabilis (strain No. 5 / NBRC 109023) TaxID=1356009 RepID=V5FD02_BYSSN|nr:predicted protein [Paecilomyces variotii No. 5]